MSAYIYANVEITDPVAYQEYGRQVAAVVAAHGGRFLVRGGAVEVLEGAVTPHRQVILEFADMAQLKAFYTSAEYSRLIPIRQRASIGQLLAIDGV